MTIHNWQTRRTRLKTCWNANKNIFNVFFCEVFCYLSSIAINVALAQKTFIFWMLFFFLILVSTQHWFTHSLYWNHRSSSFWSTGYSTPRKVDIFFLQCNQFVTSNHQIANLLFPNFFLKIFSQAVEKENKLFTWTDKKFIIFFNCSNLEKIVEKTGEY